MRQLEEIAADDIDRLIDGGRPLLVAPGRPKLPETASNPANMTSFIDEVRQTLAPGADKKHGPLPPLLVALTAVTGLVDAFSYLVLGHVFVANMTGNVVFLGFAVAGAPGFSIAASLVALGSFASGAFVGGTIGSHHSQHRGRLLALSATVQSVLLAATVVLAAVPNGPIPSGDRYALIILLGGAMGVQNAAARKLAVPELTTTVLTMTITGVAADSTAAGGPGSKMGRRLVALATMLVGALVGAVLVLHAQVYDPLVIALAGALVVALTAWKLGRSGPSWVHPVS